MAKKRRKFKKNAHSENVERLFYSVFGLEDEKSSSKNKRNFNQKLEEDLSEEEIKEILEGIEAEKDGRVSKLDISKL
jgi:Ca2+-binding EF-hand superfamily protein